MQQEERKETFNRIFLIGNGFDLAHHLKTSYKDFLTFYIKDNFEEAFTKPNRRSENDCFDVEITNERYIDVKDRVLQTLEQCFASNGLDSYTVSRDYRWPDRKLVDPPLFVIRAKNELIRRLLSNCLDNDWNGVENEIYSVLKFYHNKIKRKNQNEAFNPNVKETEVYKNQLKEIKSINISIGCLVHNLIRYLVTQNSPEQLRVDIFDSIFATPSLDLGEINLNYADNIRHNLFLNFNYTTYCESIISSIIQKHENLATKFSRINIHGDIESDFSEIIFGIGDENNDFYSEFESMYDDDWLECMKSFHYFKNDRYQELLGFTAKGDYEVYVMGHSCSITDRTLLNMLFENKYCKKIHVFHYEGIKSYLKTTYNIARNFTDKVKMREVVQPFSPDLKM